MVKKAVSIGNVRAKPGEIKKGRLIGVQLRDSTFAPLPLLVANGEKEGPTLTVISTIHGVELVGIEIIRRVLREQLDLSELAGVIMAVPVGNPLAFRHLSYVTPHYDYSNMQGSFPGSPKSSTTARITHQLSELVLKSDYFIDLHCVPQFCIPWTIINLGFGKPDTRKKALSLGQSVGFITIMEKEAFPPPGPETTLGFGMSNDIPTIIIESIDWRHFNKKSVDMGTRGFLNALKYLGMIDGEMEKQPAEARTVKGLFEGITVTSDYGGMVHMEKEPGCRLSEGDLVARILDLYGDEVGQALSPRSGYLVGYFLFHGQAVAQGDDIFYIASEFSGEEVEQLIT